LALLVVERAANGQSVDVGTWERPWVREVWSPQLSKLVRVRLPAGALLTPRATAADKTMVNGERMPVLLVPDLGTAPVASYRETLRRLVALREARIDDGSPDPEPELVIATLDPDHDGRRSDAWFELLDSVARRQGQPALLARVVAWDQVGDVVGRAHVPGVIGNKPLQRCRGESGTAHLRPWRAPERGHEQLLHLIGRHPFLTVDQLAHLLTTNTARVKRLEQELVDSGWLRRIDLDELPDSATGVARDECGTLGLVEITVAGRRQLSAWLGLDAPAATRYHGLIGNDRGQAGRRWRLLRTLAHTLGVNGVFIAFAMAADTARRHGGTDQLAEWRGAAACERRRCKPDGYGAYVRNGVSCGFFLEYDRGTESARKYAAKLRGYYWYRDSGHAARDYDGFPTLLFVTTDPKAEDRIAEQACHAWFVQGTEPLPMLITTTGRISGHAEGILGPIWRTPAPPTTSSASGRQYWLPRGAARGLFGAGRERVATPQLAWPKVTQSSVGTSANKTSA
jgi:hypothetical protein